MEVAPRACTGALRSMPPGAANQRCVAMLCLVGMPAWEVKVEGSRLRHMASAQARSSSPTAAFWCFRQKAASPQSTPFQAFAHASIPEGYGADVVLRFIVLGSPARPIARHGAIVCGIAP